MGRSDSDKGRSPYSATYLKARYLLTLQSGKDAVARVNVLYAGSKNTTKFQSIKRYIVSSEGLESFAIDRKRYLSLKRSDPWGGEKRKNPSIPGNTPTQTL